MNVMTSQEGEFWDENYNHAAKTTARHLSNLTQRLKLDYMTYIRHRSLREHVAATAAATVTDSTAPFKCRLVESLKSRHAASKTPLPPLAPTYSRTIFAAKHYATLRVIRASCKYWSNVRVAFARLSQSPSANSVFYENRLTRKK